jgi:hypothetical protein
LPGASAKVATDFVADVTDSTPIRYIRYAKRPLPISSTASKIETELQAAQLTATTPSHELNIEA